jgi:hypothetical protein
MKILREQFKQLEKSYIKPVKKGGSYSKDNKQNLIFNYKNDLYNGNININNSNIYNPNFDLNLNQFPNSNLLGNYNNISNKNIHSGTSGSSSFQNYLLKENSINPLFEELSNIKILWEDLGVTDNYQIIFENLSKDIDPIMKQDLFELEHNSLKKFSELLIVKNDIFIYFLINLIFFFL